MAIAALALLALTHWARDVSIALPPGGTYLLGVIPNFAAALAITFVPLGIWYDRDASTSEERSRRRFTICASIGAIGLIGWELIQISSKHLVFDWHDIGATLAGLVCGRVLFCALGPSGHASLRDRCITAAGRRYSCAIKPPGS